MLIIISSYSSTFSPTDQLHRKYRTNLSKLYQHCLSPYYHSSNHSYLKKMNKTQYTIIISSFLTYKVIPLWILQLFKYPTTIPPFRNSVSVIVMSLLSQLYLLLLRLSLLLLIILFDYSTILLFSNSVHVRFNFLNHVLLFMNIILVCLILIFQPIYYYTV